MGKDLDLVKLNGIWVAATTPFDAREDLYPAKIRHNIGRWNRTSVAGYSIGSTRPGEGSLLTEKETIKLWEHVAEAAAPEKLLLASTGMAGVRGTVARANAAADLGYHALLAEAPNFSEGPAPPRDTQTLFYRGVADQTKIPVVIGSTPESGSSAVSVETACLLAEHPNIIAIHECSGVEKKVTQLINDVPTGFQVLAGSMDILYQSLRVGAAGAILAFANAAPFLCLSLEEAVRTREFEAAQELQERASTAAQVAGQYGSAGLKYAMDLKGYYGGPPRMPGVALVGEAKRQIEDAFREIQS